MRQHLLLLPLLLASAGCDKSQEMRRKSDQLMQTLNIEEPPPPADTAPQASFASPSPPAIVTTAAAPSPPDIAPRSAPGVAFNYSYVFRLPPDRIAQVQEEHARACERLGVARCRITGMLYRLGDGRNIDGHLAMKLDPALAREFGKRGIEAVTHAAGKLVESQISGEDAGSRIAAATRSEGELADELTRIDRQLATSSRAQERAELQARSGQLRDSLRALKTGRDDDRDALASAPVTFSYASGEGPPQVEAGSPIGRALGSAWDNVQTGIAVMIMILVTLLPWATIGLLGWLGWRRTSRRWSETEVPVAE